MSGHHPPSWNHHPMQVPPYIPRQLPMAHMSNERPMSGSAWHSSGVLPPGGVGLPPPNLPTGPPAGPSEHNQYPPYIPTNNRQKHPPIDMNPMLPPQFGRHPMPNNDYDTPMMDLSVSSAMRNHNQQLNHGTLPRSLGFNNVPSCGGGEQDYSTAKPGHIGKDTCDGPVLGANGSNDRRVSMEELEISTRRQNPIGLPPMSEPMELVKEVLLKTIKSQVPAFSADGVGEDGFHSGNHLTELVALHSKPEPPAAYNLSCDAVDGKGGEVKEQSRRKTRKPNKTSKVVNDDQPIRAGDSGRMSTDEGEEEEDQVESSDSKIIETSLTDGGAEKENAPEDREPKADKSASTVVNCKRSVVSCDDASVANGGDVAKEKKMIRRSSTEQIKDGVVGREAEQVNEEKAQNGTDEGEVKPLQPPATAETSGPVDAETSFEEVESKLTEMFAGIADAQDEEEPKQQTRSEDSLKQEVTTPAAKKKTTPNRRKSVCLSMLIGDKDLESDDEDFSLEATKTTKKKRPATKKGSIKTANGGATIGSGRKGGKSGAGKAAIANKKKKGAANKWDEGTVPAKKSSTKEVEEVRYRGPLLQVRQDGSLGVLNGPQGQAEDDQDLRSGVKVKKFLHNGAERNKVMRGLHTNTLSMKYDTDRTDTTWVCVFCKLGPHKMGLGDLFGPYVAQTDCDEYRLMQHAEEDVFKSQRSRLDMVQLVPHRLPAVPAGRVRGATMKSPNSKMVNIPVENKTSPAKRGPKKKQKPVDPTRPTTEAQGSSEECDLYLGLTKLSDTSFEIWLHEDCIVWGSGIHMIAGRLVGVEEAVWGSTRSRCSVCKKGGAVVCCLQRGCHERVHLPCGRQSNWLLDETVFHSYCQQHLLGMGESSQVVVAMPSTSR